MFELDWQCPDEGKTSFVKSLIFCYFSALELLKISMFFVEKVNRFDRKSLSGIISGTVGPIDLFKKPK